MQITEANKQEAEKLIQMYKEFQHSVNPEYWATQNAIVNRQSVLEELKQLFPLQSYDDELILVRKCKDIIEQIEYLKSKL